MARLIVIGIIAVICMSSLGHAGEPVIERVDEKLAEFLAREEMEKRFHQVQKCAATVARQGSDPSYVRFNVRFDMPMPEGFWSASVKPEAMVNGQDGRVTIDLWRDDADGSALPHPQQIAQRFLIPPAGAPKDPERAIALILRWLDVHRSDAFLNFSYDRLSWAYRVSGKTQELLDTLNRELTLTKSPYARYAIYEEMARAFERSNKISSAAEMWEMAQDSMKTGSHPWFSTRRDLPLYELGMLYFRAGDLIRAQEWLERYVSSDYGKKNGSEGFLKLGDIHESRGDFDKAEEVYRRFISVPFPDAASPRYIEELKDRFRERVKLIEARRRMEKK